jgi:NADPH-dependent 2,4-dienoyl-CoA reductase/sulfur reductase-like enzyme
VRPAIEGLAGPGALGEADGVHLLHTMGDTFSLRRTIDEQGPATALIVGAGYVGLEMAEGLTMRGLQVAQVEMLPEVLPTVDPELGALVRDELRTAGVQVSTSTTVRSVARAPSRNPGRLVVGGSDVNGRACTYFTDLVLVSEGARPGTELLVAAGAQTGVRGAVVVDEHMRTGWVRHGTPSSSPLKLGYASTNWVPNEEPSPARNGRGRKSTCRAIARLPPKVASLALSTLGTVAGPAGQTLPPNA